MKYKEIETQEVKTYLKIISELKELQSCSTEFDNMDINDFIKEYYQEIE